MTRARLDTAAPRRPAASQARPAQKHTGAGRSGPPASGAVLPEQRNGWPAVAEGPAKAAQGAANTETARTRGAGARAHAGPSIEQAITGGGYVVGMLSDETLRNATKEQKTDLMRTLLGEVSRMGGEEAHDAARQSDVANAMTQLVMGSKSAGELDYMLTRVDSAAVARGLGGPDKEAAIAKAKRFHAPTPGDWSGYAKYLEAATGARSTGMNSLEFLVDGTEVSPKGLELLKSATKSINLSVFELQGDSVGKAVVDLLCAKAKGGVAVRVLLDEYGSKIGEGGQIDEFIGRLKASGAEVIVNKAPMLAGHLDHRKVLVVDGKQAFTGGMNIGLHYQREWHDQQTLVRGPAVAELQNAFFEHWVREGGSLPRPADSAKYFAADGEVSKGAETYVVQHTGKKNDQNIKAAYLRAINTAEHRISIANPYFADPDIVLALCNAARRGVDVTVVLPENNDMPIVQRAARAYYPDLVAAGAKVYEYQDKMAHQKVAVIDGLWSTTGSSNLDSRSLKMNDELNLVVLDAKFAASIEKKMFEVDLKNSKRIQDPNPDWREKVDRVLSFLL